MNANALIMHKHYESYPENFRKMFYSGNNATAESDKIVVPYKELKKLVKLSAFFDAIYDEGVPDGEEFEITRRMMQMKPEVFKWIPAVLELYDIHVENPDDLHFNPHNSVRLPKVIDYVRAIIHTLQLPYLDSLVPRPPMARPNKPATRRVVYAPRRKNNNSNNNKATRKRKQKQESRVNITGRHSIEKEYNMW